MANPTGKGGRKFQKGQSGNPGGRTKASAAIERFRATTYEEFINQLQKYGSFTEEQMKEDLKRKDVTMFEKIFGKIIAGAAAGEKDSRQVLLERLWGKVKDKVEYTTTDEAEREKIRKLSMQELLLLVKTNVQEIGLPIHAQSKEESSQEHHVNFRQNDTLADEGGKTSSDGPRGV